MLSRVMSVGLLAGLVAGLLIALLQQVTTTPLILLAETYEQQAAAIPAAPSPSAEHRGHDHADHESGWKPADGLPRFIFTSLATVATAVGVSFLLLAGMIVAGDTIDERRALGWAIAGFVACGLAPAAGLAPELPGSGAGALVARQIWWAGTAIATAVALWAFLRTTNPGLRLGAILLLLAPHLIGAPHPHALESRVPAEIAAQFAALSLVVQGLLWVLAGLAVGLLWPRLAPRTASQPLPS
jgi:cobalt transporter subunit CbtA